jgi:hypothetical protein
LPRHLLQRGVVKHDEGWQVVLARNAGTPGAQRDKPCVTLGIEFSRYAGNRGCAQLAASAGA